MNRLSHRGATLLAAAVSGLLIGGVAITQATPATAAAGCTGVSIPGDVNGDNRGELAVTQYGSNGDAGAVHVFYGTDAGVVTDRTGRALDDQFIDQATAGVPGANERNDQFGAATAWGDFDLDGCADLAVGAPGEDGGDGALTVLYGSPRGLGVDTTKPTQRFTLAGLFGQAVQAQFGDALAVGDLNHDGTADLAVGAQAYSIGEEYEAGAVAVLYGDENGRLNTGDRAELLTRQTTGIPGEPDGEERFGSALAIGDFDRNGVDQLAISSPGSPFNGRLGNIQVVERGPAGFTRPQPNPITQEAAQAGSDSVDVDAFGASIAAADFNRDGFADLAVGAPGRGCQECDEEYGYGEVIVLKGSAAGLTTTGRKTWTQDTAGVPGNSAVGDGFGAALAAAELNGGEGAELAIGAPADTDGLGSVTVLVGGAGGLSTTGVQRWTQDTPGIGGASGPHSFGRHLAAAYIQGGGYANLVIAAETQSIDRVLSTGLVNQLASSLAGPKAAGSKTLHLDTAGVKGKPERYAQFGYALS